MKPHTLFLIALVLSIFATDVDARKKSARYQFQKANPCPANGKHTGKCPEYVIDHIESLCAGGADSPSNMQWHMIADAKAKDREEARQCRARRHLRLIFPRGVVGYHQPKGTIGL